MNSLQKFKLAKRLKYLGKVEKLFCLLLLVYLPLALFSSETIAVPLLQFVLIILGAWILFRFTRIGMRKAIWRLRNRLLVTYLFIALVPVILIATLAGLGAYFLLSQLSVYLANSELQRRASSLEFVSQTIAQSSVSQRPEIAARIGEVYQSRFPGIHIAIATPSSHFHWPKKDSELNPPEGWQTANGLVEREGLFYAWSNRVEGNSQITVVAPLTRRYLSGMVPGLGDVSLFHEERRNVNAPRGTPPMPLPPPATRLDIEVSWFTLLPVAQWTSPAAGPNKMSHVVLHVHTRPSAVIGAISSTNVDRLQGILPIVLLIVAILFFIVEIIALVIGVSLTRTITRAVHNLYRGTQRVIEGDFTHRIQVHGKDQLGELGTSFNTMTENLERLLVIAKEKERLQAEVEIAREVQEQLYPKALPALRTIKLLASCKPARMVSGDYYDYLCLSDGRLALAMGDVAGKGISAALLMATIQAAMRMELRSSLAAAAPGGLVKPQFRLPPARLVSDLNQQLYATTAPEKYATFFFAMYDEDTNQLSYTNAGHLQPLLIRNGNALKLDVNGTVVGAFPFSKYEESTIQLESGDLLVCYTDGITEPENAYGEMYGEERLIELLTKNSDRDEESIVAMIIEAVEQWTDAEEQPDDMTLLLARKT